MKLLIAAVTVLLAAPVAAHADDMLSPPSGPIDVAGEPMQGRPQMRGRLLKKFDRNGDGRLGPRERMRASRAVAKLQRKLAKLQRRLGGMHARRGGEPLRRRLLDRFDTNHDGVVAPDEMPAGAARKLRRFDRDRDGWLRPGELSR